MNLSDLFNIALIVFVPFIMLMLCWWILIQPPLERYTPSEIESELSDNDDD